MSQALFIAATGMKAQQVNMEVVSNNLANVNTTGFKRGRADFEDLLYHTMRPVGANVTTTNTVPTGIYLGYGSRPVSTSKIFTQGATKFTEKATDFAIEGEGFFQVELPDGATAYTRAGNFDVNPDGLIVSPNGMPLLPQITIPPNAIRDTISLGSDGTVSYRVGGADGATAPVVAGQVQLAQFINPAGLEAIGSNLFLETASSGTPNVGIPGENGLGKTSGGSLEMSNVNIVDELVNMIIGQRAYEINSKAIQASDEMLETAANVKR